MHVKDNETSKEACTSCYSAKCPHCFLLFASAVQISLSFLLGFVLFSNDDLSNADRKDSSVAESGLCV